MATPQLQKLLYELSILRSIWIAFVLERVIVDGQENHSVEIGVTHHNFSHILSSIHIVHMIMKGSVLERKLRAIKDTDFE